MRAIDWESKLVPCILVSGLISSNSHIGFFTCQEEFYWFMVCNSIWCPSPLDYSCTKGGIGNAQHQFCTFPKTSSPLLCIIPQPRHPFCTFPLRPSVSCDFVVQTQYIKRFCKKCQMPFWYAFKTLPERQQLICQPRGWWLHEVMQGQRSGVADLLARQCQQLGSITTPVLMH